MADTQRSKSSILTLFADNTSGDISPQDLRDFVVTAMGAYGSMSVSDGSTAQSSIGTSFVKVTGFDTDDTASGVVVDSTTDNDLTVPVTGIYEAGLNLSFTGTASAKFIFAIAKNGTETAFQSSVTLNATPDSANVSIVCRISCSASDLLTVSVKADAASKEITPVDGQFWCRLIG